MSVAAFPIFVMAFVLVALFIITRQEAMVEKRQRAAADAEVVITDEGFAADFQCPICKAQVNKNNSIEVIRCLKCQTPAHKDCFAFNGKCGVFACGCVSYTNTICRICKATLKRKDRVIFCENKHVDHHKSPSK